MQQQQQEIFKYSFVYPGTVTSSAMHKKNIFSLMVSKKSHEQEKKNEL